MYHNSTIHRTLCVVEGRAKQPSPLSFLGFPRKINSDTLENSRIALPPRTFEGLRMPFFLLLLADAAPAVDPISGGAGWVGAGLLGLVLGWLLLVHLPAKDKHVKDVVADKDALLKEFVGDKDKQVMTLIETFSGELKAERETCEKRWDRLIEQKNANHQESVAQMNRHHEQLMARIDKHHTENLEGLKENRHSVKDLTNLLTINNALLRERLKRARRDYDDGDDDATSLDDK